jgi:hypothetical protein
MSFVLRTRRSAPGRKALPAEIYLPLVDSLYQDGRTLLVGTILVTVSVFATYWKTGETLHLLLRIGDHFSRLCARIGNPRVYPHTLNGHKLGSCETMGAPLRRGSGYIRRTAGMLVLRRLHPNF